MTLDVDLTGLEVKAAISFLNWTAAKLKAGLLGRRDRRLVSDALRELLSAHPNLSRVEDLLAKIETTPDGLSFIRSQLAAAKKAARGRPEVSGREGRPAKATPRAAVRRRQQPEGKAPATRPKAK
jgi:hypothetical protein